MYLEGKYSRWAIPADIWQVESGNGQNDALSYKTHTNEYSKQKEAYQASFFIIISSYLLKTVR